MFILVVSIICKSELQAVLYLSLDDEIGEALLKTIVASYSDSQQLYPRRQLMEVKGFRYFQRNIWMAG